MAKGANQKLKLLYLLKILMEKTDEDHGITMEEIISSLEAYGVTSERKSIYSDIECLDVYGIDVIGEKKNRSYTYHIGNRQFELAELKLLVDSVQSAKFITAKKSNELIKKLEALASKYEASKLHRQVFVAERVKTMNESIYYNVDDIHSAIGSNAKISFHYFQWDVDKKMQLRKDGALYVVSPWALTFDNGNYYLVAYDSDAQAIKHYRVDKMLHISVLDEKREGADAFKQFDMAVYSNKTFGMFTGEEKRVTLLCNNHMAGVMIDRFGKNVTLHKVDGEHFQFSVNVAVSSQFFGWLMSFGDAVKLTAPSDVVNQMKTEVEKLINLYK